MRKLWQIGKDALRSFQQDRALLAAAGVAFYITLSMIPLLLLMVSVAAFFISPAQVQAIGNELTTSFGAGVGGAIRSQVLSVVQNRGVLGGISLAIGLWAGSQVFVITQTALNDVWGVEEGRPFWVRRGLALLMVIVTGALAAIAVLTRFLIQLLGALRIPLLGFQIQQIPWFLVVVLNILVPWLVITVAFLLIYRYLSARKVTWRLALPGAIVAGILWVLVLQAFSWYTGNFGNYNALYGSLGGLVLLMLWFNYSAMIMLYGAEVSGAWDRHRAGASAHGEEDGEERRKAA
ncbi:MAG: YihY/virulence factor BrkB family protein [Armatimonadota bacterium]